LLKQTYGLLKGEHWKVANTDSVIILEEPKIYKYSQEMKRNISEIIETTNVSIKATTSEGLGFTGKKKGCAAYTSVLIFK
jgi:2-C-methyl-D-erythritol 2,4-cyclodiphosphate synthase